MYHKIWIAISICLLFSWISWSLFWAPLQSQLSGALMRIVNAKGNIFLTATTSAEGNCLIVLISISLHFKATMFDNFGLAYKIVHTEFFASLFIVDPFSWKSIKLCFQNTICSSFLMGFPTLRKRGMKFDWLPAQSYPSFVKTFAPAGNFQI